VVGQNERQPNLHYAAARFGLRRFSVAPSAIPEIKNVIRHVSLERCKAVADKALSMEGAREIKSYLNEELKKITPGAPQKLAAKSACLAHRNGCHEMNRSRGASPRNFRADAASSWQRNTTLG